MIKVTAHAIDQYRQRNREQISEVKVKEQIIFDVQEALDAGRIRNRKLPEFKLYGDPKKNLPDDTRFVWRKDRSIAWYIKKENDDIVVTTTLTPTSSQFRNPVTLPKRKRI